MFSPGPLYKKRFEIASALDMIPLQTGDIVYSASAAKGPLGVPFGRLIQKFTKSKYSHATLVLREGAETYVADVSDWGTRKLRLVDWFDNWEATDFCVARFKDRTPEMISCITDSIRAFLRDDPDYDFTFSDEKSYYCTEAVKHVLGRCGISLGGELTVRQMVPGWFYPLLVAGNAVTRLVSGACLPTDRPMPFVGNSERGMLASPLTEVIYTYDGRA